MTNRSSVASQSHNRNMTLGLLPLSLRQNLSWTFLGNAVYAGSQWGMLTILAKLGSPEMVGQFALATAVCAPIIMLTNLQLRNIQATDARNRYSFGDYLSLRVVASALALLIIAGVTFASGYRKEVALIILAFGLAKAIESVSDVIYGKIQKHERMDRIAISMMIKGPLSLVVLGSLVWITRDLLPGILGMTTVWLALLIIYDLTSARRIEEIRLQLRIPVLWHLAKYALPLGITMMLASLNANIPRYFVEHFEGEKNLGYFSAMTYVMVTGTLVVGALGQSASPRLAKYYASGESVAFQRLLFRLLGIVALLGLVGTLVVLSLGREVLVLLYQPDYAEYTDVFIWIAVAAAIGYLSSILGYGMTAAHYLRVQAPLFFLVVIIMTLSSIALIPSKGFLGAAQAMVVASSFQFLCSAAVNVRIILTASRSI